MRPGAIRRSTGDSAFPHDTHGTVGGMTLRDWFAGQALKGLLSNEEYRKSWEEVAENLEDRCPYFEEQAHVAYSHADAMLQARRATEWIKVPQ